MALILVLSLSVVTGSVWFNNCSGCREMVGRGLLSHEVSGNGVEFESMTPAGDPRPFAISYTSNWNDTPTIIQNSSVCTGDHVEFRAWIPDLVNLPELDIKTINMTVSVVGRFSITRNLVIPSEGYDPFMGPINLTEFDWVFVPNIDEDATVDIVADFTNTDCNFVAFWADTDNSTWAYRNDLLGRQMATGAHPEVGVLETDRAGTLAIGCINCDGQPGTYTLEAHCHGSRFAFASAELNKVFLDTYIFGNKTLLVEVQGTTVTDSIFTFVRTDVIVENHFAPRLGNVIVEVTDSADVRIDWTVEDANAEEEVFFDVLLSVDDGVTYHIIESDLSTTSYTWDSTGFLFRDTYRVKIRGYDNDPVFNPNPSSHGYWPGLTDEAESISFAHPGLNGRPLVIGLTSPADVEYIWSTIQNTITWTVSSLYPTSYSVFRNDTLVETGSLQSGGGDVVVNIDGLDVGVYKYWIEVSSAFTDWTSMLDIVYVSVGLPSYPGVYHPGIYYLWKYSLEITIVASFLGAAVLILWLIERRLQSSA